MSPDHREPLAALHDDLTEHPAGVARTALHQAVASLDGQQTEPMSGDPENAGPRLLTAAGDLNADGVGDAVETHGWSTSSHPRLLLAGHLSATAVDGTDGGTLWSRPFETGSGWDEHDYGFGTVVPVGDLDGRTGDDLLVVDVAEQRYGKVWSWEIGYSGVVGRDGTELWRRTYQNPSVFETNASYTSFVDINLAIPLSVAGDADGDGTRDLLIARHHYVFGYSDDTFVSRQAQVMGFDVLSGATGKVLSRIVEPDLPASAEAAFVPDMSGDGKADVVTVAGATDPVAGTWTGAASAYRGVFGIPLWRTPLRAPSSPHIFGYDLTGDRIGEAVVLARGWDLAAGFETTVQTLAGRDGRPLWSHREDGVALLLPPGDATRDGGADLLIANRLDGEEKLRLTLLKGASGGTAWSRVHPGGLVELAGDVTRDGAADVLVRAVPYIGDDTRRPASAISSGTGDVVWSQPVGVEDRMLPLLADVDRDGYDDIVQDTQVAGGGTYQVLSGRDATPLWAQRPVRYEGDLLGLTAAGTSARGSDAPRILESVCRCDGEPGGHVTTARDVAGLRVWRRVDGTPLPSPVTTSLRLVADPSASGQYTDEVRWQALLTTGSGEPVPDAPVVFELGTGTAVATTDQAGVATVTMRLTDRPGEHSLHVSYRGDDDRRPSALTQPFTIRREQVALTTDLNRGEEWTLIAVLTDRDDQTSGLAGRSVTFHLDGTPLGSAVTDQNGVARFEVPPSHRRAEGQYAARFAGDAYYEPA